MSQRLEGKYHTFERFKPHDYLSRLWLTLDNYWTAIWQPGRSMLVSVVSYTGPEKYNADVKIKGISRWN